MKPLWNQVVYLQIFHDKKRIGRYLPQAWKIHPVASLIDSSKTFVYPYQDKLKRSITLI